MSSSRPTDLHVAAYGTPVRIVRAALVAVAGASLPGLLFLLVAATDPPVTPALLMRLFALAAVAPALGAWMLRRALGAEIAVANGALVIARRDRRFEVPLTAIARVVPWALPLPGPGLSLHLRSGRRLAWSIETDDPLALVQALGHAGDPASEPALAHAHARAATGRWPWYRWVAKYPLFGLLPTAPLFNVHQHIAYGGPLGEYYLLGPRAYLIDFAIHWGTVSICLVLWAGVWRGLAEAVALGAAHVAPSRAARVRRAAETACWWLYYAGVPLLLLLRFAPW